MNNGTGEVFNEDIKNKIEEYLKKAKEAVVLVSPYLSTGAAEFVMKNTENVPKSERLVITLPLGIEYITGASDIGAVEVLRSAGYEVRCIDSLHTKLFTFDNKALVGSANMTNPGWNIDPSVPNKEVLVSFDATQLNDLIEQYKKEARPFSRITPDLKQQLKEAREEYLAFRAKMEDKFSFSENEYITFLQGLQERQKIENFTHIKKNRGRNAFKIDDNFNVKISYSGRRNPSGNYSFTITQLTRDYLKRSDVRSLVLVFENLVDFVWLPRQAALSTFLIDGHKNKYNVWQFRVENEGDSTYLRSKASRKGAKEQIFDVTGYTDVIRKSYQKHWIRRLGPGEADKLIKKWKENSDNKVT